MRNIRFRAWDEKEKRMLDDEFFITTDGIPYWNSSQEEADLIIQQFTGLHDKNGKEIYENDILRSRLMGEENEWEKWEVEIFPTSAICSPEGKAFDNSWIEHEIIGNRFEHPELIKQI